MTLLRREPVLHDVSHVLHDVSHVDSPPESEKVAVSLFAEPNTRESQANAPAASASRKSSDATGAIDDTVVVESRPKSSSTVETDGRSIHYSEDLSVGDTWSTELRRITSNDVDDFSNLTGDHTPLHGQSGSCSPFGKPVAHGLLGLSILAGLGSNHPNASTLALVGIEDWQFLAPVFIGDMVSARNEIVLIEPHGRRAVKVRWLRQLLNEAGRAVQQGYFVTLVGSRSRSISKPR